MSICSRKSYDSFVLNYEFVWCSVLDIKEAFQELDVEVIMELYQQANRNKQVLFEMCLQM